MLCVQIYRDSGTLSGSRNRIACYTDNIISKEYSENFAYHLFAITLQIV